jgi:hypothetical protein
MNDCKPSFDWWSFSSPSDSPSSPHRDEDFTPNNESEAKFETFPSFSSSSTSSSFQYGMFFYLDSTVSFF